MPVETVIGIIVVISCVMECKVSSCDLLVAQLLEQWLDLKYNKDNSYQSFA